MNTTGQDIRQNPGEGKASSSVRVTPHTTAGAQTATLGVSVGNVFTQSDLQKQCHEEGYRWFAMRVTYGKDFTVSDILTANGVTNYLAVQSIYNENHKKTGKVRSLLRNIIFVFSKPEQLKPFVHNSGCADAIPYLHWYYDKTSADEFGRNEIVTIPFEQMRQFVMLTTVDSQFVEAISVERRSELRLGDLVEVTEGPFRGVCGNVARYKRQDCVVIELEKIGFVKTAYIPAAFLRKI